ncbi:hypothetical protein COCVIDRAFT_42413 [Bipolaris victoriae FI3]|uniref:Uncharacterized protein n=1 Tax=Bipolaris victoriae (strain FI3) TaxID=930091 RepID=W7DZZ1_BIPV3|nr:hypothetical protein COCVIDRAFT_42413 [Bipolaris victoriae FI3]
METILVVGSTGNIGTAAVSAALRTKRSVLAIVRNQNSADKLIKNVRTFKGITVVDQVRAGKLPAFQHIWSSVGGEYTDTQLPETSDEQLEYNFELGFKANFCAYRDTIGYLLEQKAESTWTICTGSQDDIALYPVPAMTQGALFSMVIAACRDNWKPNVCVNEVLLGFRVEVDEVAKEHGVSKILARPEIRSSRIRVDEVDDLTKLRYARRFPEET